MPKVSIIIPVYNAEPFIRECLDSILNQTMTDIEIIAVDDCGVDNSISIVEEYSRKDTRIKIVWQGKNMGPMLARENGYKIATGDYYFFCDSDDTLPKDALQVLYNEAILSNADIVIGNITSIEMDGTSREWKKEHLDYGHDKIAVFKSLFNGDISHNLCAKLFKADLFRHHYVTIPNMRNGEDAMLFYQMVENVTNVVCVDKSVYNYIQHSLSSSHIKISPENIEKLIQWRCFLYNKIIKKYAEIELCGGRAVINVLVNIWVNSQNYSKRKFVKILKTNNLLHLFAPHNMLKYMSIKDCFINYFNLTIRCQYYNTKSLIEYFIAK